MQFEVTAVDLKGVKGMATLDRSPDTCPRCHRAVSPQYFTAALDQSKSTVQAVFRCPHHECQGLFIGHFQRVPGGGSVYRLHSVAPTSPRPPAYSSTIQELSPTFVEIAGQVATAEGHGLEQLAGIGLRKGLEFLIKDFAIKEHPTEAATIRATQLGPCITKYIADTNVNVCAKRAAWLGNDETHYVRKWATKDIKDLKVLIHLTVNWIDNVLLTAQYVADMDDPSKPAA